MSIGKGYGNILNHMEFLTEAESVYAPAMVPVVENTRLNTNIISLENLISFAESNDIEDLGYALNLVCEASEIEPSTVSFSVDKVSLIESDDIANMTSEIMDNGVGVFVKPLSAEDPIHIIGEAVLNHGIETGDFSLLEEYINNDEILNEDIDYNKRYGINAKAIHRKNLVDAIVKERKKAGDTRSEDEIKQEMERDNSLMKHAAYWKAHGGRREIRNAGIQTRKDVRRKRGFAKKIDPLKEKNGGTAQFGIDLLDQYGRDVKERHGFGKDIVLPNTGKSVAPHEIEIAGRPKRNYNPIEVVKGNPNGSARPEKQDLTANTPSTPKGGFDISRLGGKKVKVYKSDTSTNYQVPEKKETEQTPAPAQQTTSQQTAPESKPAVAAAENDAKKILDKAQNEWMKSPRNVIAKKIAWLHDKLKEFNDKVKSDGKNAALWKRIISYITRAIQFLTKHLHNVVVSKGHEIGDGKYSDFYSPKK